jgi:hypothetical protein
MKNVLNVKIDNIILFFKEKIENHFYNSIIIFLFFIFYYF